MTIELPPDLPPKGLEAIEDLVAAIMEGHTGQWCAELLNGVPQKRATTAHRKFGRGRDQEP